MRARGSRAARTGAAWLALAVLLAACGASAAPPQSTSVTAGGTTAAPESGQSSSGAGAGGPALTIGVRRLPVTLDPHMPGGATRATGMVASLIWPQVFQVGPSATPVLDTEVVTSAEVVSLSPQTVVYQIAPSATWSDGVPVSAADFVYAWKVGRAAASEIQQVGQAGQRGQPGQLGQLGQLVSRPAAQQTLLGGPLGPLGIIGYGDISSVTGSNGGRTVTVVFKTPFADWEGLFSNLLPAQVLGSQSPFAAFGSLDPATRVSAGPYELSAWTPGSSMVLTRNPHWWGPKPVPKSITLRVEDSSAALVAGLRRRSLQMAWVRSFGPGLLTAASSMPSVDSVESQGTTIIELVFNTDAPLFASRAVRRGIAHLVDRSAVDAELGRATGGVVGDGSHFFTNLEQGYADDSTGFVHAHPRRASADLGAGGVVRNSHGSWSSAGTPIVLKLMWPADNSFAASAGAAIAGQLEASGFDVTTQPLSSMNAMQQALDVGAYELALVPVPTSAYPTEMRSTYIRGGGAGPGGFADLGGLVDPRIVPLLTQASQELDPVRAYATYRQIDQYLWSDMATLPLFAEPNLLVTSTSLGGVTLAAGRSGPLWDVAGWTWTPSQVASRSTRRTAATTARKGAKAVSRARRTAG